MANGADILDICDHGDVDVRLHDGRLVARMRDGGPLRDEARAFIARFRAEVLAELKRRQAGADQRTEVA